MTSNDSSGCDATRQKKQQQHVILFYKYHPLSSDAAVTERYRAALATLCSALRLTGRILVAKSANEGINGTLAGSFGQVKAFTRALIQADADLLDADDDCSRHLEAVTAFRKSSRDFFNDLQLPELVMTAEDFKWSASTSDVALFPDLNIKLVKELIGTGGLLESIPISETAKGYLTPSEWHERMLLTDNGSNNGDDTILIDCRNTKEYEIGHFTGALDPQTNTFSQFSHWVNHNEHLLADKNVLMYCTGGIRCEKASAYIRQQIPTVKEVNHLKGGIHKYLEEFGSDGTWKGRNFVFDSRVATTADETCLAHSGMEVAGAEEAIVGSCTSCSQPYDDFCPSCVCTVCREPLLVCPSCRHSDVEFHCRQHYHLKDLYFTSLDRFSANELRQQLQGLTMILSEISVGRKFKRKRKTIVKQVARVQSQLDSQHDCLKLQTKSTALPNCRHCGDAVCTGQCWGFHGLKRKLVLEDGKLLGDVQKVADEKRSCVAPRSSLPSKKEQLVEEISSLMLSQPVGMFRDEATGIRVPPCTTRVLRCYAKPKWCGQPILKVLKEQFYDFAKPEVVKGILDNKLLRLNGKPVEAIDASRVFLKNGDTISRILHWHEAPVIVPARLIIDKISLPSAIIAEYQLGNDSAVYVCDKPSSVPVHPAGPYLSNTLTMMAEAQEQLEPASLIPLHRTDRVTSGLVLMCTNPKVTRIFHQSFLEAEAVRKLYLAKVNGKFSSNADDFKLEAGVDLVRCAFDVRTGVVEVSAPVETIDPANGIRAITEKGKPARSLFRLLKYDSASNTSFLACFPVTGKNHQLRVHLSWLGFPIIGDVLYGGAPEKSALQNSVLSLMANACSQSNSRLPELTKIDIDSAKASCSCCNGGRVAIHQSFTSAQLLLEGYAIRLHALRYQVKLTGPKKSSDLVKVVEFAVPVPDWAAELATIDIPWLTLHEPGNDVSFSL